MAHFLVCDSPKGRGFSRSKMAMKRLLTTLASAAENLALDEALLDHCDEPALHGGVLRLWELPRMAVVMGRGSPRSQEVNLERCATLQMEVVRRSSGGLGIVTGPGCLMYSVVLSYAEFPELRQLDAVHDFVLDRIVSALSEETTEVSRQGTSDLVWQGKKFSGNSLRCKKNGVLYHGTLLYDFPLSLVSELLHHPPREPEYRQKRSHDEFITNLPIGQTKLIAAMERAFPTSEELMEWPREAVMELMATRYGVASWHEGRD